jgi:peptide/nickel transport system substrate-binding protein
MKRLVPPHLPYLAFLPLLCFCSGCLHRPTADPNIIVVVTQASPNNLDPRFATDDAAQKADQLMLNGLMRLDEHLRVVPDLAERLDMPSPTRYVATLRQGVRFQDGHELTADDVVFTYQCVLDPAFLSPLRGGYRGLEKVEALDRYTVAFTLKEPFGSFPVNLVLPGIVPAGAGREFRDHPVGTGPYRFVRYLPDDRLELAPFDGYFRGAPKNAGVILRIVPDDIMRGLELRKGTADLVINDLSPDLVYQLKGYAQLQEIESPGVDYQYVGLNMRDPILRDVRVRQALAYAIDRHAIVEYLRRGLATPAVGLMPPLSWAFAADSFSFPHNIARARALLDEAGYPDPGGAAPRFRLTLKISQDQEFNRLQATVIQQNLQDIGVALDVRSYDFATMYADVLNSNFQMYTLQWTAGSLADPDILRRVLHSTQAPPAGFNRGHFSDAGIDALLDEAATSLDEAHRLELFKEVQRRMAIDVPYISLWNKMNFVIAQRSLSGVQLSPRADLMFLKDVSRGRPAAN